MPMTYSRPGQNLNGSDPRELFYKKFAGEVLAEYEQKNVFANLIWTRTINSGKSAGFPLIKDAGDPYLFRPGVDELTGSKLEQTEKVINIDGLIIADTIVAEIDEWMNEFEIRSKYAKKLAYSMAKNVDYNIAAVLLKATQDSAASDDITVTGADFASVEASDLVDAIANAAQILDENNVDDSERYLAVAPAVYFKLFKYLSAIDKDYGGQGSIATGKIIELFGFNIVKTNTLKPLVVPTSAGVTIGNDYSAEGGTDHRVTVAGADANDPGVLGLAFVPEAAAMLKLRDLMVETQYDIRRQGNWLVTKMAVGFGYLRPEATVLIKGENATIS